MKADTTACSWLTQSWPKRPWAAGFAMLVSAVLLTVASSVAAATPLPIGVTASGNRADVVIGNPLQPIAEVSLDFQDATGLTPASLGVSAQQIDILDPALLARLPNASLNTLPGALPLLVTIEPPATGGLSFRNTGRMEIHTHAIPYSIGSSFRVFKAPLGGAFRDVTDEIAQGSTRARTTYGGFSQFLILLDLRGTGTVIDEKIGWLRNKVAALPQNERGAFNAFLDQAEAAVDAASYSTALSAIDSFRARAQARAGQFLPNEWRATRTVDNQAGDLVAGANTLSFSVAYLRDFGQ